VSSPPIVESDQQTCHRTTAPAACRLHRKSAAAPMIASTRTTYAVRPPRADSSAVTEKPRTIESNSVAVGPSSDRRSIGRRAIEHGNSAATSTAINAIAPSVARVHVALDERRNERTPIGRDRGRRCHRV
jgi:hypothetical protein